MAARSGTASDRVFRDLCSRMFSGALAPGDKLPTQRRLAAELGVNMGPVREALKRLEQLGVIDVRHGDAMRVLDWRTHAGLDVLASIGQSASLSPEILDSALEARRLLLGQASCLAAERRAPETIAELRATVDGIRRLGDEEDASQLDLRFCQQIAHASGNVVFALMFNSMRQVSDADPELFTALTVRPSELVPMYETVIDCIESGDARSAESAAGRLAAAQELRLHESAAYAVDPTPPRDPATS
ncbi:MAG: FadR/GntR family transcriptional regulator [Solirubrobacterales bacterium]